VRLRDERGIDVPMHVDAASGGFVWPFLYPESAWDFRLDRVHSINVSGHKYGLVYPGIGWLIFRDRSDLPEDLAFYDHYLGQRAAERGWMVPAYTLPPDADHLTIMRALVKQTLGHALVSTLADDIAQACETLDTKGGLHEIDRRRVKTNVSY